MIIGLGIDLVEISRMRQALKRHGERFARKILHPDELLCLPPQRAGSAGLHDQTGLAGLADYTGLAEQTDHNNLVGQANHTDLTGLVGQANHANPASLEAQAIFLASRFAAKEAAVKALGTGFVSGIWFQDLCVRSLPSGQPEMIFLNGAAERFAALRAGRSLLSITHSRDTAAAVLVLET